MGVTGEARPGQTPTPEERCLWWEATTRPPADESPIPPRADVAIIGGGYSGLAAARALGKAGAQVAVLERHRVGWGASGRNGGFVLPGFKADLGALCRKLGPKPARELFQLSLGALGFIERLVSEEAMACEFTRCGHVTLAARRSHMASLETTARLLRDEFGHPTVLLGPGDLGEEIGSSRYQGGLLDPAGASLQPAKYLCGLAAAAVRSGARLCEGVEVRRLRPAAAGFVLETTRGVIRATEVLIATNGYTGALVPAVQGRLVPIGSYIIATDPLPSETVGRLIPRGRVLSDTKNLLFYFRLSADGRMVFGGRASFTPTTVARAAEVLRRGMVTVFPELARVPIRFAWGGALGFTRDLLPHAGRIERVHYAVGYGGHGVALATYLGDWMGRVLAGQRDEPPPAIQRLPAIPLYRGRPWFLPLVGAYYGIKDRLM